MAKVKSNAKVKVQARKKPVKAKLSSNSGGIFTAKVAVIVNKTKANKNG